MAQQLDRPYVSAPFTEILDCALAFLSTIADHLHEGQIRVPAPVRICRAAPDLPKTNQCVRLGVFPVTGNPLHWGHLLCALEAIAELALDQVVFLVQGTDARKPLVAGSTEHDRHVMARQVVAVLDPLAGYSDLGRGNSFVGEENLFRLLRLNPRTSIVAHYLVGADHYRLADQEGQPDTLPRLEQNMTDPAFGFDATRHEIRVVFVERGRRGSAVPTKLSVRFLPETLAASSTEVRSGRVALAPHLVYRYLERHPTYARAIGFDGPERVALGA